MRRVWRVCKWILILLLCLSAFVLLLNGYDEPVASEVTALLQDRGELLTRQQNMYYAAMGFSALAPDMEEAGWTRVQAIDAALRAGKSLSEVDKVSEQPRGLFVGDKTHLPGYGKTPGELLGNVEFLQQHAEEAGRLLADNRVMLDRYAALNRYPRFLNTTPPNILMVGDPPWEDIVRARRLWKLEVAGLVAGGRIDEAIDLIRQDARFWRRLVAEPRIGLIGKLICATQVAGNLQMASQLVHAYALTQVQLMALNEVALPLTAGERSMAGVFVDEFRQEQQTLLAIGDPAAQARLFGGIEGVEKPTPGRRLSDFVESRFYLPMDTLNRVGVRYHTLIELDGHACDRFNADQMAFSGQMNLSIGMLRNPVGKTLADISGVLFRNLTGRMCDLQGFQRLLALQLLLHQRNIADDQVAAFVRDAGADYADPFTGQPMQWQPQPRSLSFGAMNQRDRDFLPWLL